MEGHSHALSGACTGLAAGIVLHEGLTADVALAGFTAGMALLPDLDSIGACASRSLGFISESVAWVIRLISGGHRHASHSLVGIAVFTGLAWVACLFRHDLAGQIGLGLLLVIAVAGALEALHLARSHVADLAGVAVAGAVVWHGYGLALIPLAVLLGTCAHVAGDAATCSGVPLLWPVSEYRFRWWPSPLAFTTGTKPELWLVDPALMVLLGLLAWDALSGLVH